MSIAVVDIGSNTIKLLVAEKKSANALHVLFEANEDVRLSPRFDEPDDKISARAAGEAVAAIRRLIETAKKFSPVKVRLVATSMVREAGNAAAFRAQVYQETGYGLEVLSGESEALAVAAGVATDPLIADIAAGNALRVVDLGGGSMECIFKNPGDAGVIARSFPLGAVRLTRQYFSDPTKPIPPAENEKLAAYVRAAIKEFFEENNTDNACVFVGCGGAFSVASAIFAMRSGRSFDASESAKLPVPAIRALRDELAALSIFERVKIPCLPAARADILPAALTTLLVVAELAGVEKFFRSRHNLRYGIAVQ